MDNTDNYIDKMVVDDKTYPLKDTSSAYITKDVNDLTNYMNNTELEEALAGKAEADSVPEMGRIAEGDTGYATGGDVYDTINTIAEALENI